MEAPIKAFELKCKTLLEVVKKVSEPIKLQLNDFEEKRKAEKEKEVQNIVKSVTEKLGLNDKYASQLTIIPKYLNKTQKDEDTLKDLEMRGNLLLNSQQQEEQLEKLKLEKMDLIQTTLEEANKKYGTELKISDFNFLLEKESSEIPKTINARANYLYQERLAKENTEAKKAAAMETPVAEPQMKNTKVYNFILKLSDCSFEQAVALKQFLIENKINYILEQKQ